MGAEGKATAAASGDTQRVLIGLRELRERHLPSLSMRWIYELVRSGRLPSHRLGRRWLVDADAVLNAIRSGEARRPGGDEGK